VASAYIASLIAILVGLLAVLPRAIRGPTLLDRILAVNVIGTKTIIVLALVGFLQVETTASAGGVQPDYNRASFFLDIAIAYALINFIATIAIMRYLEARARARTRLGQGQGGSQ
jgi:multicomponent Na+:H+ antiporter subunit F